jgi:hypothetical protein
MIPVFTQSSCTTSRSLFSSNILRVFADPLQHNLKARGSGAPYEFRCVPSSFVISVPYRKFHRAIESILLSVLSALEAEMVFIRNLVGGLLAELEDDINHDKFKRLLHYSRRLAAFKNRAKLVRFFFFQFLRCPLWGLTYPHARCKKLWKKCSNKVSSTLAFVIVEG